MQDETYTGLVETIASSEKLILVDFYADWCGPCKMIAPLLEELSTKYKDTLTVLKINIENEPGAVEAYGIRAIPTLLYIKDSETVDTQTGNQTLNSIDAKIEENL